jgi:hypothetical protein
LLVFLVPGCAQRPGATQPASSLHWTTIAEFDRQTLVFRPTRDDITVGCALLNLYPHRMEEMRVNGDTLEVPRLYLKQVGRNEFELPKLKIELADAPEAVLCMSIKPLFNEATNQNDGRFYQNLEDRYALVSWCSREPHNEEERNGRMRNNPVRSLEDFKTALAQSLVIPLNNEPLLPEYSRHPMISAGIHLNENELTSINKLLRDRGERFIITIARSNGIELLVSVGDDSYFRSTRLYTLVKNDGNWEIARVERSRG